ncbi:uncharacterized protein LOC134819965 isoform X2 [Bolinopsis microptera]|uniref:uncharacterized protein LOC134819965 isoform X2 n=1 Tax=Bolinopsis microptera TaxID=2820187 RepID=UPI00307A96FA
MTGMTDHKPSTDDYIPMSTNMMDPLHSTEIHLMKPDVRFEEDKENDQLHIPLTPSPDLLDHSEDIFCKLPPDNSACGALSYSLPFPVFNYPSYTQSHNQDLPAGYFNSPFPTPSPVSTPQSFVFDPTYPQIPYTSHPGNMMVSPGGDFASRHLPALPLLKPPPAKRRRTKAGKKTTSSSSSVSGSKTQSSNSGSRKSQKNAVASKVNELKTTLLEYHDAASDELWRPGGEPKKKNKSCQTTFKQPLQLASYEEFASLALLLSVFHKEATDDAGKRYGVKCKG